MRDSDHLGVSGQSKLLLPANIDDILEKYGYLLKNYMDLRPNPVTQEIKRTNKRFEGTFPFKEHPLYGITGMHVVEKYSESGYVRLYEYEWKIMVPKMGIQRSHITSWGNDPHNDPSTPLIYKVRTEPHHHHYDPNDRKKRRENDSVRTMIAAFEFVSAYISSGQQYIP